MLFFSCLLGPYLRSLVEAEKYTVTQFPERADAPEGLLVPVPAQPCSRGALPPARCSGPLQRERCDQRGADTRCPCAMHASPASPGCCGSALGTSVVKLEPKLGSGTSKRGMQLWCAQGSPRDSVEACSKAELPRNTLVGLGPPRGPCSPRVHDKGLRLGDSNGGRTCCLRGARPSGGDAGLDLCSSPSRRGDRL